MTDIQFYLAICVPAFTIVTSLIVSLVTIWGIKEDMREMRREFNASLTESRKEAREDRLVTAKDAREDRLVIAKDAREDRLIIAADIKLLTGKVYELMGQKQ